MLIRWLLLRTVRADDRRYRLGATSQKLNTQEKHSRSLLHSREVPCLYHIPHWCLSVWPPACHCNSGLVFSSAVQTYQRSWCKNFHVQLLLCQLRTFEPVDVWFAFSPYCWSNVNMLAKQWFEWIDTLLANCVPRRTTHRSSFAPWITPTTSKLMKRLETAYQQKGTLHCTTLRLKKNAMLQ